MTDQKSKISEKNTGSSFIFYGGDQEELYREAILFADSQKISKFDIVEVQPEAPEKTSKFEIRIKQIRELISGLSRTPSQGKKKLAIIHDADKMNEQAQNALLKTLEEPAKSVVIILLSSNLKLLPTIISRCQIVKFAADKDQIESNYFAELGLIKNGNIKQFFALAEKMTKDENLPEILESWLGEFSRRMIKYPSVEIVDKIKIVFEAKDRLEKSTNKKLIIENMLIKIIG
ncbi:MAG: hypothetical protein NTW79_00715 [Candidatus Berkelbacteria bacterium]|nr:hypothetical protein [Candidatus Berkelbacteria bacterium]